MYPNFTEAHTNDHPVSLEELNDAPDGVTVWKMEFFKREVLTRKSTTDMSAFTVEFHQKSQQIINGVKWAMSPAVSDEVLRSHGLSEEQFVVKFADVTVEPVVTMHYSQHNAQLYLGYMGELDISIFVDIHLQIEDISAYAPGETEALRLKYLSLCDERTRYSGEELKEWAINLGIVDADVMTKSELCSAVGDYYGFR